VLHVFGHIHGAYGAAYIKDTLYVNASICTERYEPTNKPIIVDITEIKGKIIATYVEE
jgi:Icc-related predicted phosphoesterase